VTDIKAVPVRLTCSCAASFAASLLATARLMLSRHRLLLVIKHHCSTACTAAGVHCRLWNSLLNKRLAIAVGSAVDLDKCAWGESYWCSDLHAAKACGAVKHCTSTVWKNQKLPQVT